MMPGTQPQSVSKNTMSIEPQPRSITASGGKIMARMAWRQDVEILVIRSKVFLPVLPLRLRQVSLYCKYRSNPCQGYDIDLN